MIILFFGQPASGKTTIANEFMKFAEKPKYSKGFFPIDGDEWRKITQNTDYSKSGRYLNLKTAFDMARYVHFNEYVPVLSFVTPYKDLRDYLAKDNLLMQVYLEYEDNRGRNQYFANEFEKPEGEYLSLNTTKEGIIQCTTKVLEYYEQKFKA